jgi:hypothetical protein
MRNGGLEPRRTFERSGRGETVRAPSLLCVAVAFEFPVFSYSSMVKFPS